MATDMNLSMSKSPGETLSGPFQTPRGLTEIGRQWSQQDVTSRHITKTITTERATQAIPIAGARPGARTVRDGRPVVDLRLLDGTILAQGVRETIRTTDEILLAMRLARTSMMDGTSAVEIGKIVAKQTFPAVTSTGLGQDLHTMQY